MQLLQRLHSAWFLDLQPDVLDELISLTLNPLQVHNFRLQPPQKSFVLQLLQPGSVSNIQL